MNTSLKEPPTVMPVAEFNAEYPHHAQNESNCDFVLFHYRDCVKPGQPQSRIRYVTNVATATSEDLFDRIDEETWTFTRRSEPTADVPRPTKELDPDVDYSLMAALTTLL